MSALDTVNAFAITETKPRRSGTKIFVAVLILTPLVGILLFLWHLNTPRVVARAVAPDGTEFCVVQTWTRDGDLFNTSCYYRKPGGPWGWFYYDHEDWYWGRGTAEIDEIIHRISITRDGRVTAVFNWRTESFQLLRSDFPHRTFTGAQEWMPAGWSIGQK